MPNEKREFNNSILSPAEIETLKEVATKFRQVKTNDIIEISHKEEAWKKNFKDGKRLISYIDAFKLVNV